MATGLIFNNARVMVSTATCHEPLLASSGMYNLSTFVQRVAITGGSDTRDNTVMGMSYRSEMTALRTAVIEIRALQQFSKAAEYVTNEIGTIKSIDELMFDLYSASAKFIVAVRPDNEIRTSCNPEYWMPCALNTHVPVDGAVADLLVNGLRFTSQGNLTRTVSSS